MSRAKYYFALGGTLFAMGYAYRRLLSDLMFKSQNIFLSKEEVQRLKDGGEIGNFEVFEYQKHLNPNKETVVIELDGASGLILADVLDKVGKVNIVGVSREESLIKTSSGSSPIYGRRLQIYPPGLQINELWSYGKNRLSFIWNKVWFSYFPSSQLEENLDSWIKRNKTLTEPILKNHPLNQLSVDWIDSKGAKSTQNIETINKRYWLQTITEGLVFKQEPMLLANKLEIGQLVFSKEDPSKCLGVVTSMGIVLGDYFVLSTEIKSKERAERLGLVLPINSRNFYFSPTTQTQSVVDESSRVLSMSGQRMSTKRTDQNDKVLQIEVTADGVPIVCKVDNLQNCYLNLGYGGNTFTLGYAGAEVIKNAIVYSELKDQLHYSRFYFAT